MYAKHDNAGHDAWRKNIDDKRDKAKATASTGTSSTTASTTASAKANNKKLALSESLRTALCTQAGLSANAADRIWKEAYRDSGNE